MTVVATIVVATAGALLVQVAAAPGLQGEVVKEPFGDLDGDGKPEAIVGVPDEETVHVTSGEDGSELFTLRARGWTASRFGAAVTGAGDLDGDGTPDIAVAAPGVNRVFVFGSSLGYGFIGAVSLSPGCSACQPALSLAPLTEGTGETKGMGSGRIAGFLVGVPGANGGDGMVLAVVARPATGAPVGSAGRAGEPVFQVYHLQGREGEKFGFAVAAARGPAGEMAALVGTPGRNRMVLVSLPEGRRLAEFASARPGALGQAVASLGDVDGDGVDDFAAADPEARDGVGRVVAFSGADGSVLWSVEGGHPGARLGSTLAFGGDRDGDGVGDLVAAFLAPGPGPGLLRLAIFSGRDGRMVQAEGELPARKSVRPTGGGANGPEPPAREIGAQAGAARADDKDRTQQAGPLPIQWRSAWLLINRQAQPRALLLEGHLGEAIPQELARVPWEVRLGPIQVTIPAGALTVQGETLRLARPVEELEELHVGLASGTLRLVTRRTDLLASGELAVELAVAARRWWGVVAANQVATSRLVGRPSGP